MKSERKWMVALAERIIASALIGGFSFAGTALGCGVAAGALTGFLGSGWNGIYVGAFFGLMTSFPSGLVGAFIYGIAAARAQPGPQLQSFETLRQAVTRGQVLGTLGACGSFVVVEIARAQIGNVALEKIVSNDSFIFMFVAPATMICGAIASTIFGREAPQ